MMGILSCSGGCGKTWRLLRETIEIHRQRGGFYCFRCQSWYAYVRSQVAAQ